jgi:hypothetical protein
MIYLQVKSFTWSQLLRTISILGESFSAMADMTALTTNLLHVGYSAQLALLLLLWSNTFVLTLLFYARRSCPMLVYILGCFQRFCSLTPGSSKHYCVPRYL